MEEFYSTRVPRKPRDVDVHVGRRVRLRRNIVSMSQEQLSSKLGVSFQQVQKFEKGINRIGASRLHDIALALRVPVSFFFEGLPGEKQVYCQDVSAQDLLATGEAVRMARAFAEITDPKHRKTVLDLARSLAGLDEDVLAA